MPEIIINKQTKSVQAQSLEELIKELNINTQGVAIAIDGRVVGREQWSQTPVSDGQQIVLVAAVYGG